MQNELDIIQRARQIVMDIRTRRNLPPPNRVLDPLDEHMGEEKLPEEHKREERLPEEHKREDRLPEEHMIEEKLQEDEKRMEEDEQMQEEFERNIAERQRVDRGVGHQAETNANPEDRLARNAADELEEILRRLN